MKTEVERVEKNQVLLTVEVPADAFATAIERTTKTISTKIAIPGFRKGRVPNEIVEQRVGKEYIVDEAVRDSVPYFYAQAVNESGIFPIDSPEIDVEQAKEGEPLIFKAKVEVKPDVTLGDYRGLEIERPQDEVAEAEVEEQKSIMRARFGSLDISPDEKVAKGDFALIDFKGTVDDGSVEGGSAEDYLLEIGSESFVPGVEDQIIGMTRGETRDIWVDMPEDYNAKQIAGKRVKFETIVKEIKRKRLPEMDDDFAKQVGFDTLTDMEENLRSKMAEMKKTNADVAMRNDLIRKVTDSAKVEIPPVMVERKLDEMVADFSRNLESRGLSFEQYIEASDKSMADLKETLRGEAELQVRSGLVLEAISKAENLEASDEDIDNEIRKFSESLDQDPAETRERLKASGTIELIVDQVLARKTIDALIEMSKIKVVAEAEKKEGGAKKKTEKKAGPKKAAKGAEVKPKAKSKGDEAGNKRAAKPAGTKKKDER